MKKLLILSLLVLSACGKFETPKDPRTVHGVDPAFVPYVETYLYYKGSPLAYDIPIGFTDLPGDTVGMCTRFADGHRQITIDRGYWESHWTSDAERVSLIFHELGHCDLNRGHSPNMYSIMYEYNWGHNVSDYYELFHPDTSQPEMSHNHDCVEDIP